MKKQILTIGLLLISLLILNAQTNGNLSISVTTSETGGHYAPRNVLAIWIEGNSGNFVKTLLVNADRRKTHLNTWQASTSDAGSEYNNVDAITSATNSNHGTHTCSWNGTDYNGNLVSDGSYKVLMELTDKNETGNSSSFDFTKGSENQILTPADEPSFASVNITWEPEVINGIEQKSSHSLMPMVFPNPGKGMYKIVGEDIVKIEVQKITGKVVMETTQKTIDLSGQEKGMFLFHIYFKDYKFVQKVVNN